MSSPPISVTAQLLRQRGAVHARCSRLRNYRGHRALHDGKHCLHELQPIGHSGLGQREADKQLESVFGAFHFHKAAAGLYHTDGEKQHEQPVPDGLQRAVDTDHDRPHLPAAKGLWAFGQQLPDLGQFAVPGVEGGVEVVYDPAIAHMASPPWFWFYNALARFYAPVPMIKSKISFANVMTSPPASVRNP